MRCPARPFLALVSMLLLTLGGCGKSSSSVPKEADKGDVVSPGAPDTGLADGPKDAPLTESQKKIVEVMRFEHGRVLGKDGYGLPLYAKDKDPSVRAAAARAMGRVGDPEALRFLDTLLVDKEPEVSTEAAFALGIIAAEGGDDVKNGFGKSSCRVGRRFPMRIAGEPSYGACAKSEAKKPKGWRNFSAMRSRTLRRR